MGFLEAILNRLRGTGLLYSFGKVDIFTFKNVEIKLVWNHIYGLYLALIIGYLSQSFVAGLGTLILYLVGESKGWGEWVGALTRYEGYNPDWLELQYKDNEGKTFPYIHQITEFFVPERIPFASYETNIVQYLKYAKTALTLRGIYWWMPIYLLMAYYDLTTWWLAILSSIILGVLFPVACIIGSKLDYNGKIGVVNYSRGWENQELVYGLFQGIVFWSLVFIGDDIRLLF